MDTTAHPYIQDEASRRASASRVNFNIRTAEGERRDLARTSRMARRSTLFHLSEVERYLGENSIGDACMHARFARRTAESVPTDPVAAEAAQRATDLADEARIIRVATYYARAGLIANA